MDSSLGSLFRVATLLTLGLTCVACPDDGSDDGGLDPYPECVAATDATLALQLVVDGTPYDVVSPPSELLFSAEGICEVTTATSQELGLQCPDLQGEPHTFELGIDANPPVALPAAGTSLYLRFFVQTDDLSPSLEGYGLSLRDGTEDGPLRLAVNGGHSLVLPELSAQLGPADVCDYQEIDEVACRAYRRTWVAVDADGSSLEAFDHDSIDADDGSLRMVVGDAVVRTVSPMPDDSCGGSGLGPGRGRFDLVIGAPG